MVLKDVDSSHEFIFRRTWTTPRTVFLLSAGPLALVNMTYLVTDADLASEGLHVALPVLQHLVVDTKTVVKNNGESVIGSHCSPIGGPNTRTHGGQVHRLVMAPLNSLRNSHLSSDSPSVNTRSRLSLFKIKKKQDLFPRCSLIDPVGSIQHKYDKTTMDQIVE